MQKRTFSYIINSVPFQNFSFATLVVINEFFTIFFLSSNTDAIEDQKIVFSDNTSEKLISVISKNGRFI